MPWTVRAPRSGAKRRPARYAADELALFGLTDREREVLLLLADGRSNPEIAQALFISPKTASVHVSNILAKLGVSGRVEAAAVLHRLGASHRGLLVIARGILGTALRCGPDVG